MQRLNPNLLHTFLGTVERPIFVRFCLRLQVLQIARDVFSLRHGGAQVLMTENGLRRCLSKLGYKFGGA